MLKFTNLLTLKNFLKGFKFFLVVITLETFFPIKIFACQILVHGNVAAIQECKSKVRCHLNTGIVLDHIKKLYAQSNYLAVIDIYTILLRRTSFIAELDHYSEAGLQEVYRIFLRVINSSIFAKHPEVATKVYEDHSSFFKKSEIQADDLSVLLMVTHAYQLQERWVDADRLYFEIINKQMWNFSDPKLVIAYYTLVIEQRLQEARPQLEGQEVELLDLVKLFSPPEELSKLLSVLESHSRHMSSSQIGHPQF